MACRILDEYVNKVRELVDHQSMTYSEVSNYLPKTYGGQRGFSERSVPRKPDYEIRASGQR